MLWASYAHENLRSDDNNDCKTDPLKSRIHKSISMQLGGRFGAFANSGGICSPW